MNETTNKEKKKRIISTVFILLLMCGVLIGTFALWQTTRKQTNKNLIESACLSITFSNETDHINLPSAWPMTDSEGKATTPYGFTITNNCDKAIKYQVNLESIENPNNSSGNYINDNYIDVYLDDNGIRTFGSLITTTNDTNTDYNIRNTKKISTGKLFAHESKTHNLRLWIDEDTPDTEMNKAFYSKIKVVAGQGIELDCYSVNTEGVLTKYNTDCGMTAVIPATVDNIPVRKIASEAFTAENSSRYRLESGYVPDDISFSIMVNTPYVIAAEQQDYATLANATTDDVKIIKYKDDKDGHIEEAINALKENPDSGMGALYQMESISSLRVADINIYNKDTIRPSEFEYFYKITNNNGDYVATMIGRKETKATFAANGTDIAYLDLSHATNLEEIEDKAFSNLWMMDLNLTMPSSLKNIGEYAFGKISVSSLTLNDGLQTIEEGAFIESTSLSTLNIPSSVTQIGRDAFANNSNLTITVHNQDLYNTRSTWAPVATVVYEP